MEKSGKKPTFLIIGVKKAGSTWLFNLLKSHKQIYVPKYRKEVNFFGKHYSKGIEWYKSFFPRQEFENGYKVAGEATPGYIFDEKAAHRIKKVMPEGKFIVILRNPVNRMISEYKHHRQKGSKRDYKTFAKTDRNPFRRGLYAEQLNRWFKLFDRDQFLILIFESCIADPELTKRKLAEFLLVDAKQFRSQMKIPKNSSFKVRMKKIYIFGLQFSTLIRKLGLDSLIYYSKKAGILKVFKADEENKVKQLDQRKLELLNLYDDSITDLEKMLDIDLSFWRKEILKLGSDRPEI